MNARTPALIADPPPDHYRDFETERRHTLVLFIHAAPHLFRKDFEKWLRKNFQIYVRFEKEADAIWNGGRRRYSQRTIYEFIRHETNLREAEGEFKLNDWYVKDIARLYICAHPDRAGFFEFRNGQSAVRVA